MKKKRKIGVTLLIIFLVFFSFCDPPGNEKKENYANLRTSAGASTEFYSKSPSVDGHYPATHSFKDIADGTSGSDTGFVIAGGDSAHFDIISDWQDHLKVGRFFDDDGSSYAFHDFDTNRDSGIVEFWWGSNDVANMNFRIYLRDGGTNCYYFRFVGSQIQRSDGLGLIDTVDDTWYHIKIQWYNDNTIDLSVDGDLVLDGDAFDANMTTGLSRFMLRCYSNDNTKFMYIDAYAEDWDIDYDVGDNLYSEPISMINGTFDNTDNMKINDDSNSEFISTQAIAIPDEFINSITINNGVYVSGSVSDTWVDNSVAYVIHNLYITKMTFNFDPALVGRDFYISGHFETTGGGGGLYVNGVLWKTGINIDFDDDLYNGVNSIYYTTGDMGDHQARTFYLKFVEVGDPSIAIINYTMDIDFSEIQSEILIGLNVSSYHYTNVSTTIEGNIYNYTSSSYVQMFSTSNTVETGNFYSKNNTNVSDFLNSTGYLRLQFKGSNSDYTFKVIMDYIVITFNYTTLGDPPFWLNLIESPSILELGDNETISIEVYTDNEISNVYIEFNNVNYSMYDGIENDTYYYEWKPSESGVLSYKIYMIDNYNLQNSTTDSFIIMNSPNIVLSTLILLGLMGLMLVFYLKKRIWLIILSIYLFSVIFGLMALNVFMFPFTPFLQLFFVMFQTIIFLFTSLQLGGKKRGK